MKLKHESRRGPGEFILVAGSKFELDADGCVEVDEAAASLLTQGAKWRAPEFWGESKASLAMPEVKGGQRRARTRAELLAAAEGEGIVVAEKPADEPAAQPEAEAIEEEAIEETAEAAEAAEAAESEEVIEVSAALSKAELLAVADRVGLDVPKGASKRKILSMFAEAE